MKLLIVPILLFSAMLSAQSVPHAKGTAHTEQVDIGYETMGTLGTAVPVIAVNGGPGLSHAYMVQNALWERVAKQRLVVLYDQRGTGASKAMKPGASQSMDAQVADLDAVRQALGLDRVALVGDSYGGLLSMAYAAAHPDHVAKLVLSDSPGPSWKSIVHDLPDVFPDIQEQGAQEAKKLGDSTDEAARAGLRNHFRMIFYSPENRRSCGNDCGGRLGRPRPWNRQVSSPPARPVPGCRERHPEDRGRCSSTKDRGNPTGLISRHAQDERRRMPSTAARRRRLRRERPSPVPEPCRPT